MSLNALLKSILLSFVIAMFMTLPAYAAKIQLKGGYSNLGANGTSFADGYLVNAEYLFNRYVGIAGQIEGYSTAGTSITANYNLYSTYLTFHSDLQNEDSAYAYLNNYVKMYYQLGYTSLQMSTTTTGTATVNTSLGGFSYGLGFDIMPKSRFSAFVGYRGFTVNNNSSMDGLVAGVAVKF